MCHLLLTICHVRLTTCDLRFVICYLLLYSLTTLLRVRLNLRFGQTSAHQRADADASTSSRERGRERERERESRSIGGRVVLNLHHTPMVSARSVTRQEQPISWPVARQWWLDPLVTPTQCRFAPSVSSLLPGGRSNGGQPRSQCEHWGSQWRRHCEHRGSQWKRWPLHHDPQGCAGPRSVLVLGVR